ncbi:MAG: PqqD family protein [Pyrinomonadaceae bacterium]
MKPIARKDDLVIQEVGGEILVYDLKTNKAICLNQTSALVWQNCDGKKDAMEIAKNIEKELGSNVSEDFVWFAVNQLEKENLLIEKEDKFYKFEGLNRRDVIKRIGLASVIALPLISTIVAPTAANAQSRVGTGGACTQSSQCISNCCQATGTGANTCKSTSGNCLP